MSVHKAHRSSDDGAEPDLVQVDLGRNRFTSEVIIARLKAEGIKVGSWDVGSPATYGVIGGFGGFTVLVRRSDLPAVQAAMADAGIA